MKASSSETISIEPELVHHGETFIGCARNPVLLSQDLVNVCRAAQFDVFLGLLDVNAIIMHEALSFEVLIKL